MKRVEDDRNTALMRAIVHADLVKGRSGAPIATLGRKILDFLDQEVGSQTVGDLREDLRDLLLSLNKPSKGAGPSESFVALRAAAQWAEKKPTSQAGVVDFATARVARDSAHFIFPGASPSEAVDFFMTLHKHDPDELFEEIRQAFKEALEAETSF